MYNRYTCPLQACRYLTLKRFIQGYPRSAKVSHVVGFKNAYISLIIGPRGLACVTNLYEIMGSESSDVVKFDLGPLLQGQMRIAKLQSSYNLFFLLVLEVCNVKPTSMKSWAGNPLKWSDLALGPSFKVKGWFTGFDELSVQWIQFASVLQCAMSSYYFCLKIRPCVK